MTGVRNPAQPGDAPYRIKVSGRPTLCALHWVDNGAVIHALLAVTTRRTISVMISNRSMPRSTVLPELAYPDIGEAISRLCEAFGFTLRIRMGNHRAQLNVGDGAVILIETNRNVSLKTGVMVRVEDVNSHCEHARRSGIHILREPADYPYGERQYNAEDFAGHHWCFSQSIADIDPRDWGGTPGRL